MKRLLLIITLINFNCYSQNKVDFVKVTSKPDAYLGIDFITDCTLKIEKILKTPEPLELYGYEARTGCDYYKAINENMYYYIKSDDVSISDEQLLYLKTIDTSQQADLLNRVAERANKILEKIKSEVDIKSKAYLSKGKQNGILIGKSQVFDVSEYTVGTGYEVKFINLSKKTIKYMWFTVKGINAVNDPVGTKTLKGVGPLSSNSEGSYSYDYVWFTDLVESSKLVSIKIQYMDGSFKTIPNAGSIIVPSALYEYMFPEEED